MTGSDMKTTSHSAPLSGAERRILLIVTVAILATAASIFWLFYHYVNNGVSRTALESSDAIFSYVVRRLPAESLLLLNRPEDNRQPLYREVQDLLKSVRDLTAVRYLYTTKLNAQGKPVYVVDGLEENAEDFHHIGDLIEPEVLPQLQICLGGKPAHADKALRTDWGDILPACTPVKINGRTVGAVVMEFDASLIAGSIHNALSFSLLVSCALVLLFLFVTAWLLRRLSVPFYRKLAYTDLLTGINNRNAFELDVKRMSEHGGQDGMTVLVCDLDMLKKVNDLLGHAAGDAYICSLARLLTERFKDRGETYRIGGDEFATLLPHADRQALDDEMRDLRAIGSTTLVEGFPLLFAHGLAIFDPARDTDLHSTLTRADSRMYALKRAQQHARAGAEPTDREARGGAAAVTAQHNL